MGTVISKPVNGLPIGEPMNSSRATWLLLFYRLLLSIYPPGYRAEFGKEMYETFLEGVEEAQAQRRLGIYVLRELRDTPRSIANAYWDGWGLRLGAGMRILQDIASTSDLPPPPPDGRLSWRQAFFELSLFMVAAFLLILITYFGGADAGWRREPDVLGRVITSLTLPFLFLGLARGSPRWAYPFGGLVLSYHIFVSDQASLWLFLLGMSLAFFGLALAEALSNPQPSLLPLPLRRMRQSISADWTRLSFGLYGAMPLVILQAFDDGHVDSRTPYLALSVLAMVVCALLYCRSRETTLQVTLLLAGLTFSIFGAWLDRMYFAGGLLNWVTVPAAGIVELAWLLKLWLQWGFLILLPAMFILVGRVARLNQAV